MSHRWQPLLLVVFVNLSLLEKEDGGEKMVDCAGGRTKRKTGQEGGEVLRKRIIQ